MTFCGFTLDKTNKSLSSYWPGSQAVVVGVASVLLGICSRWNLVKIFLSLDGAAIVLIIRIQKLDDLVLQNDNICTILLKIIIIT